MPQGNQDDCANQCPDDGNTKDINIANSGDDDNLSHQPDANEGRNNRANEAKWQAPTHNGFSYQPDDSRDNQVNDEVQSERPEMIANFNDVANFLYFNIY